MRPLRVKFSATLTPILKNFWDKSKPDQFKPNSLDLLCVCLILTENCFNTILTYRSRDTEIQIQSKHNSAHSFRIFEIQEVIIMFE